MRILENLSTCTMQRINWGLFSRAHCYTIWDQENRKGSNEAFSIRHSVSFTAPVHRLLFAHTLRHLVPVTFVHMLLSLKVSLRLIHNGVPCLLVLWCFQRATPLTVVACTPRPSGSFLRVCRLPRAGARAPSRKLRWHQLLSCVGGGRLVIARQQWCYVRLKAPATSPIYTTTLSIFIIHISCGIMAWKTVLSFMVEGRLQLAFRSHGSQQDGVWGGGRFSEFKASKQPIQIEKKCSE